MRVANRGKCVHKISGNSGIQRKGNPKQRKLTIKHTISVPIMQCGTSISRMIVKIGKMVKYKTFDTRTQTEGGKGRGNIFSSTLETILTETRK